MAQAKVGDTVKVHYTGRLNDGTVFDSSVGDQPLEFTIGKEQVIPGFENIVIGMEPGDKKTGNIPADDAYGRHQAEAVIQIDAANVPQGLNPNVGDQLVLQDPDGNPIPVVVTEVADTHVTLDANHPLAGQDLVFDIELVSIGSVLVTL